MRNFNHTLRLLLWERASRRRRLRRQRRSVIRCVCASCGYALDEELTNKDLAQRLGKDPATVLHHVRLLVDNGFLAAGDPRRGKRNSRERPYRATRKSWVLDFSDDHAAIDVAAAEAFAAELREASPSGDAPWWSRLGVRLSPDDRRELQQRLDHLVGEFEQRDSAEGEPVSIYLAVHRRQVIARKETA